MDSLLGAQLRAQAASASKLVLGASLCRSTVRRGSEEVRLRRLSEYGAVAYFVERPMGETQAELYLDTVRDSNFLCVLQLLASSRLCASVPRQEPESAGRLQMTLPQVLHSLARLSCNSKCNAKCNATSPARSETQTLRGRERTQWKVTQCYTDDQKTQQSGDQIIFFMQLNTQGVFRFRGSN